MGYILKTFFGLGIVVATITGLAYAVGELLQIGTCASGGPYEVARECPPGTDRLFLAFVEIVQTEIGPEWYVQLVSDNPDLPPPWSFGAPLDLGGLTVGGSPPQQIEP